MRRTGLFFLIAAAAIAAVLIDDAIPSPSPEQPGEDRGTTGSAPVPVGDEGRPGHAS